MERVVTQSPRETFHATGINNLRLGFAGHETFPFRHGWLKKGIDASRRDPKALSSERAIVTLGVGKNMVESIHHWGLATRMLSETSQRGLEPSAIGRLLLEDGGWDPYLEHPASIWLIHWLLVTNPARAATWTYAFGYYPQPDFSKDDLVAETIKFAAKNRANPKPATIGRDVDCLVRSYVTSTSTGKGAPEDAFDCPLTDLELIRGHRDNDLYRFAIGPKRSLPALIVGFALLEFAQCTAPGRRTFRVGDCMYQPGSPGQVFKLDENSFVEHVEELSLVTSGAIQFDDTSGLRQVYLAETIQPHNLLARYYKSEG